MSNEIIDFQSFSYLKYYSCWYSFQSCSICFPKKDDPRIDICLSPIGFLNFSLRHQHGNQSFDLIQPWRWIKSRRTVFSSWLVLARPVWWGIPRSRCSWLTRPNIDARLFSALPTHHQERPSFLFFLLFLSPSLSKRNCSFLGNFVFSFPLSHLHFFSSFTDEFDRPPSSGSKSGSW